MSPGSQVTITNKDGVEHSVTSKTAGQFDTEVDANGQKTFTAPAQLVPFQSPHPFEHVASGSSSTVMTVAGSKSRNSARIATFRIELSASRRRLPQSAVHLHY